MLKPQINVIPTGTAGIDTFLGYNHSLRIGSGELYDMKNLTGDNYPVLTPRNPRGEYFPATEQECKPLNVTGAISIGGQIYYTVLGGRLITGQSTWVSLGLTEGNKTLIANGAYILIFPDKVYYNTADPTDYGSMEAQYHYKYAEGSTPYAYLSVWSDENEYIEVLIESLTEPSTPQDGMIWFSASADNPFIKRWNAKNQSWVSVDKLGFSVRRHELTGFLSEDLHLFNTGVKSGDVLSIPVCSYITDDGVKNIWDEEVLVTAEEAEVLSGGIRYWISDLNSMLRLCQYEKDYLVQPRDLNEVKICRLVPDMDYVLECNNRIWGCRFGINNKGEFVNEIYASKQGDFRNWNTFAGVSTDSYVASCGSSGPFTGAVNFNGRPLFFKQDHYWLVSGDYPAQFGYVDAPITGVMNGSARSLTVINRQAYYHAIDGVRVFDGYDSVNLSAAFGGVRYVEAVGGTEGDKYYLSCRQHGTENWTLFVYDTVKGLWHKEDDTQVKQFFPNKNRMFLIDVRGNIIGTDRAMMENAELRPDVDPEVVEWYAETGDLLPTLEYKYLHEIGLRMRLYPAAEVRISVEYDGNGVWQQLCKQTVTSQRFLTVPVHPQRCDHLRLRIAGTGRAEIYAISKKYKTGSDKA